MNKSTNKIFNVIQDCGDFLSWLHDKEGIYIKEMPDEFKDDCKQLQKLGIVYKRNNRNLGIKWIRLRRLLERSGASVPSSRDDIIDYCTESDMYPVASAS